MLLKQVKTLSDQDYFHVWINTYLMPQWSGLTWNKLHFLYLFLITELAKSTNYVQIGRFFASQFTAIVNIQ